VNRLVKGSLGAQTGDRTVFRSRVGGFSVQRCLCPCSRAGLRKWRAGLRKLAHWLTAKFEYSRGCAHRGGTFCENSGILLEHL